MIRKLYKAYSGALQFTVFIGVIVVLILGGLMMLQNTHNFFMLQSNATIENIQLANSGINFLKTREDLTPDTLNIKSLESGDQMVQVQLTDWGIYEKALVKTTHRKKVAYKVGLLGSMIEESDRPNLYLEDKMSPLTLVGHSYLKGNIFISAMGVRPGIIGNTGFNGNSLIEGKLGRSTGRLPEFKKDFKYSVKKLLSSKDYHQNVFDEVSKDALYKNSFLKPTLGWYSKNPIIIEDRHFSGNIIISSDVKITVKKTAILTDVILIAPDVEILDGFVGSFQAIANRQITVGENCLLKYPSSLVILNDCIDCGNSAPTHASLIIDNNTEIRGSVIYLESVVKGDNFDSQILLKENSSIKGEIYCEANLELVGKVIGSVYTGQFIAHAEGSVFMNHIYNGQIDNQDFPGNFCGMLLKGNKKGVAKWIY